MFNFQLLDNTGSTKQRFTGAREREQICRQVKVLSSQQRISPEGSQTDSQPKLEGQIYTQLLVESSTEQLLKNFLIERKTCNALSGI